MNRLFLIFLIIIQPFIYNYIPKKINKFDENNYIFSNLISIHNKLLKREFKSSIKKLESLESLYTYHPYIQKIYVYLIYAHYKSSNFEKAKCIIEKFFYTYLNNKDSNSEDIDFVLYINGMIHTISEKQKFLRKIFCMDSIENDVQKIYIALASFSEIIDHYSNSKFYKNANKYSRLLKKKLIQQELKIVRYYMKKRAYVAVINRSKKIYEEFPENKKIYSEISSYIEKIKNYFDQK